MFIIIQAAVDNLFFRDVQGQEISGFECQAFTNLNHDLWAFNK